MGNSTLFSLQSNIKSFKFSDAKDNLKFLFVLKFLNNMLLLSGNSSTESFVKYSLQQGFINSDNALTLVSEKLKFSPLNKHLSLSRNAIACCVPPRKLGSLF